MQYVSTRGRSARPRLFRRGAGRAGPRRRPLRAARMAAVLGRRDPRHARPCLSRARDPRAVAVPRRRDRARRSSSGWCARPMPPSATTPCARWSRSAPNTLRAGAVPRPDARLQGRGDAAAGAADGPCAGRARPARHHRRRHLGRHRRRGDRGLRRARPHRHLHPLSRTAASRRCSSGR